MTPFAIAGLQLQLSAGGSNLPKIEARIDHLMHVYPWVQMIVLSELAAYGPDPRRAEELPGPAEHAFCALAHKHRVWLIPGSLFEEKDGRVYNAASVINPQGRVVERYRKMFPFRPYETDIAAGTDFVVFEVPRVGLFGISICYDLWFPETIRTMAAMGAEVVLHPCLTATIERDVEVAMARAAAAQNQCYVIDVNGLGAGGNGRSAFIGPSGDMIYLAGTQEQEIPVEIDVDRVRREREVGLFGLGQPLKSFRDREVDLAVYRRGAKGFEYLATLGPLVKPERGSKAGLK